MNTLDAQLHREIRTAIKQGDFDKFSKLIHENVSGLTMSTPFGPWLHVASSFGQLAIVAKLVELGADINKYCGIAGGGPLHRAASDGHYDVVQYLLDHGADLDVSEPERNPLFGAIHNGHIAIVKLLVDRGIDTHVRYTGKSMKGMDAIAFAREWGRSDIVELLIAKDRDPEKNRDDNTLSSLQGFQESSARGGASRMATVDIDLLRRRLAEGARSAFNEVRAAHPDEMFYAFALYTVDDAVAISASASSDRAYSRVRARYAANGMFTSFTEADHLGNFRWSPYDWEFDCDGGEFFRPANELRGRARIT